MTSGLPAALEVADASWVTERLLVGGDLDLFDNDLARRQLLELTTAGVTHIVDLRLECNDEEFVTERERGVAYRWLGIDDAGQVIPDEWFDQAVGYVMEAFEDQHAVVLTHCHMGINRGPSLGYAVLLAQGWDCVEAIATLQAARPIAYAAYAEDALRWHHERQGVAPEQRLADRERLRRWRHDHAVDLVRVVAERRSYGD